MTQNEKEALVGYLEFHLVKLCEQTEKNLDPDAVGTMYDSAYGILNEIERSLQDIIDFDDFSQNHKLKKPS